MHQNYMIWEYLGHQCLWLVCTVRGIDIHGIRTMQATSERCECGRRKVQRMSSPIQPLLLDKFKIHQLLIGWIFSPSLPEAEWIEPLKRERERLSNQLQRKFHDKNLETFLSASVASSSRRKRSWSWSGHGPKAQTSRCAVSTFS